MVKLNGIELFNRLNKAYIDQVEIAFGNDEDLNKQVITVLLAVQSAMGVVLAEVLKKDEELDLNELMDRFDNCVSKGGLDDGTTAMVVLSALMLVKDVYKEDK